MEKIIHFLLHCDQARLDITVTEMRIRQVVRDVVELGRNEVKEGNSRIRNCRRIRRLVRGGLNGGSGMRHLIRSSRRGMPEFFRDLLFEGVVEGGCDGIGDAGGCQVV